jgi:hypothetical protein
MTRTCESFAFAPAQMNECSSIRFNHDDGCTFFIRDIVTDACVYFNSTSSDSSQAQIVLRLLKG